MSWPLLRHLERFGPRQKFFDAFLIENALERPTALLEGLKRKNYDNGLCYCHVPLSRYVGESKQIPSPAQKVFCVYAEPTPNGAFQIIDWEWRRVETGATGVPKNWRRDFERLIWPTN